MEAGRYSDTTELALPSIVASLKYIDIDCGTPEMLLNSSTNFTGKTNFNSSADFKGSVNFKGRTLLATRS